MKRDEMPQQHHPTQRDYAAEPTVGAVVVNYNGGDRVLGVLDALHRQQYPLAEIVVVDNDSTDDSPARIGKAFPTVRLLELEMNKGLSAARNVGLRNLNTSLALLIDHDVYVDDCCIERMVRAYNAERPAVVCPRIRLVPERDIVQVEGAAPHFLGTLSLRHGYRRVDDTPPQAGYVNGSTGGCMLVQREQVLNAGGFDELFFFYLEDLEFSLRLRGMGYRFWCEPSAEVFHEPAKGTPCLSFRGQGRYPPRRAYLTMRNRLLTILIHYRLRTLLVLLPALLLYELVTLAVALKRRWLAEWARAWLWQFRNFPTIIARRRRMQSLRTIDDRELLVGGDPPLAPGFLASGTERHLVRWFSCVVNTYWSLARNWIA
jgi:GT2 family glycosyltransferase